MRYVRFVKAGKLLADVYEGEIPSTSDTLPRVDPGSGRADDAINCALLLWPEAEVLEDNDGNLVVYTNVASTG